MMDIITEALFYDEKAEDPTTKGSTLEVCSLCYIENEVECDVLSFQVKGGERQYTIRLNDKDKSNLRKWCKSILGIMEIA